MPFYSGVVCAGGDDKIHPRHRPIPWATPWMAEPLHCRKPGRTLAPPLYARFGWRGRVWTVRARAWSSVSGCRARWPSANAKASALAPTAMTGDCAAQFAEIGADSVVCRYPTIAHWLCRRVSSRRLNDARRLDKTALPTMVERFCALAEDAGAPPKRRLPIPAECVGAGARGGFAGLWVCPPDSR